MRWSCTFLLAPAAVLLLTPQLRTIWYSGLMTPQKLLLISSRKKSVLSHPKGSLRIFIVAASSACSDHHLVLKSFPEAPMGVVVPAPSLFNSSVLTFSMVLLIFLGSWLFSLYVPSHPHGSCCRHPEPSPQSEMHTPTSLSPSHFECDVSRPALTSLPPKLLSHVSLLWSMLP